MPVVASSCFSFIRGPVLGLSLLANIPVESLFFFPSIFQILCKVQFDLHLGLPDPISALPDCISVFFRGHAYLLPLLSHFLDLTCMPLLSHAGFQPHLLDFIWWGLERCRVLRRVLLKSASSAPFFCSKENFPGDHVQ